MPWAAALAKAVTQALAFTTLTVVSVAVAVRVVGMASAQLVAPSDFTPETVPPIAPFGDLPINPGEVDRHLILEFLEALDQEERTELEQRCSVVTVNGQLYDPTTVRFCTSVIVAAVRAAVLR
jgi:hypothetical protein